VAVRRHIAEKLLVGIEHRLKVSGGITKLNQENPGARVLVSNLTSKALPTLYHVILIESEELDGIFWPSFAFKNRGRSDQVATTARCTAWAWKTKRNLEA
jgi:hypothetical protein